jgi:hypothetical protein
MNRCYLQLWEQSSIESQISDGCSLHTTLESHYNYIEQIYNSRRSSEVPEKYERVVSFPVECFLSDELFDTLLSIDFIKLSEVEKLNLIKFEDIILK